MKFSKLEWGIGFIFLLGILLLAYATKQDQFERIFIGFSISFGTYFLIYKQNTRFSKSFLIGLGLVAHVLTLFSEPSLTDDLYRYLWDGILLNNGYDPFEKLPIYYIENNISIRGINESLFNELNSPNYFSIYPPFSQWVFRLGAYFFPENVFFSGIIIRLIVFLFQGIGMYCFYLILLKLKQATPQSLFLYFANPLLIIELSNGLHTESLMISLVLVSLYLLISGWFYSSSATMGLALSAKFVPLIFFPVLLKKLGLWKIMLWAGIAISIFLLSFFTVTSFESMQHIFSSIDLYFRKFEFNASFYYLIREAGYWEFGFNRIAQNGPLLAGITLFLIADVIWLHSVEKWKYVFSLSAYVLVLQLLFTTTVHPWYLALPLVLSLLAGQKYMVVWTAVIWLTYVNYNNGEYNENLYVVTFEYFVLFSYVIYSFLRPRMRTSSN